VSELPTGTVSLLFSDIEGSTALLAQLGPAYAETLNDHRRLLRKAWADHGGTELGTEGDSFFVVFPTAPEAVAAAAQAQLELDQFPWPNQEPMRVRMGIHTGFPQLHDGDYVGMDVHRAARIAGAAHGGQIVVSSPTAELARVHLPVGVSLRDLGDHRLKDLPGPEHLFQISIEGLPGDFPPLKTLGAASSLPRPATALVGRDRELAELRALLGSSDVRLVTLTGPGGSGKTRLAIALAQHLVERFPGGVYFVPLAAVTTAEVMRVTTAEVLDVPPDRRGREGLFDFLAHGNMLLVLDNLEQIDDADAVLTELLQVAGHVVMIATSRRALSVPGEHMHPVPTLELPAVSSPEKAASSGAVRLFIQQAKMVQPGFDLTPDNTAEVVQICRRLDGLPLAIELAAARTRLLSPRALLSRLDNALDIASSGRQGPFRQRTLRDTIAWSYDLLHPTQRAFFRRLGVFSGGAGLDAVAAVTAGSAVPGHESDPLETVAELVDASLATVTHGQDGEPRVELLETIRAYARDQLGKAGETDAVRSLHAGHYLDVAQQLESVRESQHLVARNRAETELENFREALAWTVGPECGSGDTGIGLQLCSALGWFWYMGGYLAEGRSWFERVIRRAGGSPSRELASCLGGLANTLITQGEFELAREIAAQSLEMSLACGEDDVAAFALLVLGTAQLQAGDLEVARRTLEESLDFHRRIGNPGRMARALGNLAGVEELLGHYDRAEELTRESLNILRDLEDIHDAAVQEQNLANLLAVSGRVDEANRSAEQLVETVLKLQSPHLTLAFANTYMNILIRRNEPAQAAHLLGAEDAMRERNQIPNPHQQEELEEAWSMAKELISVEDWDHHYRLGREETLEGLFAELAK
jgi:predicted ATPase/class 3 adenylate cyclase